MAESRLSRISTILDAKAATGVGSTIHVIDHRHILIELSSASSADLTVKCQGSISETAPTFSSAQSVTNHWDYIQIVDMQNGSPVEGDDGVVLTGTDDFRIFMVGVDGLKWLNFNVTARAAGSVTVKARLFQNN